MNLLLVIDKKIYCVNLGDSRACGLNKDEIVQTLSRDHKPLNPTE
jgi:serine/threonine protein phosphatase PrpC